MKEKNIFIGIVVVAMLAIGAIMYRSLYRADTQYLAAPQENIVRQQEESAIPAQPVPVAQHAVVYTATGFAPVPLVILAGQTVLFKNEHSADMWVASAPHPTHTDYSGFDASRPYGQGETYSFTFTRIGTWKYHNHLNPAHYGSIVVE